MKKNRIGSESATVSQIPMAQPQQNQGFQQQAQPFNPAVPQNPNWQQQANAIAQPNLYSQGSQHPQTQLPQQQPVSIPQAQEGDPKLYGPAANSDAGLQDGQITPKANQD